MCSYLLKWGGSHCNKPLDHLTSQCHVLFCSICVFKTCILHTVFIVAVTSIFSFADCHLISSWSLSRVSTNTSQSRVHFSLVTVLIQTQQHINNISQDKQHQYLDVNWDKDTLKHGNSPTISHNICVVVCWQIILQFSHDASLATTLLLQLLVVQHYIKHNGVVIRLLLQWNHRNTLK